MITLDYNDREVKRGSKIQIHPHLTSDPFNKRGKVGEVKEINEFGDATVKFSDGTSGVYSQGTFIIQD